jgi:hypothetical protein
MSTRANSGARAARGGRRYGCLSLPFTLALRVFRPNREGRVTDSTIELAQILRTSIGLAATGWLVYAYPLQKSAAAFAADRFSDTFVATGVLLVAGPLVLVGFVASARPPARAVFWRRLGGPVGGFASLFASTVTVWLLLQNDGGIRLSQRLGPLQFVGLLAVLAVVLFATAFGLTAAVLSVHYVFRTGDVHEVLPALISPLLAWSTFVFQLLDDSAVAAPAGVQLLFLVGPPLSVTGLSLWELRRLRTHFGVTVRRALNR